MISVETRRSTIAKHRRHEGDSGSPEVQISMLTARILELTEHLKGHPKDHASRRGLVMMVGKRNSLLKYLAGANREAYQSLIRQLGLRK